MADDVMAQMGFGVADEGAEQRMKGVANQLRGDRNLGQFFQFSGSDTMRDAGRGMVKTAQTGISDIGQRRAQGLTRAAQAARDAESARVNAAQEARAGRQDALTASKYETAQGRLNTADELTAEALQYDRTQEGQEMATGMQALETAEATRAEDQRREDEALTLAHKRKMEAEAAKDKAARERATIKAAGDAQSQNLMPSAEKGKYRIATTALDTIPGIISQVESNPEAFGMLRGADDLIPDGTPNLLRKPLQAGLNAALTDEQQQTRVAVYQQAYDIIHSLAGAALSATELKRIEDFTPAKTDSMKTVVNKLKQAEAFARKKHEGFKAYNDYTPYSSGEEETTTDEVVTPPDPEADAARIAELRAKIAAAKAVQGGPAAVPAAVAPTGRRSQPYTPAQIPMPANPQGLPKSRMRRGG